MDHQRRGLDHRYCANLSILFTELPYPERFAAARAAGFSRIETWWPWADSQPSDAEIDAFLDRLTTTGLRLQAMNFFAGDMPAGERGIACRPDRQDELDTSTAILVRIAEATGCRLFNLLYGQLDDRWSTDVQHDTATEAIRTAAERVRPFGGTVLVEALADGLNGNYPLRTPQDVTQVIERLTGTPNVGLLFDIFHLGSNGVDLITAVREYAPLIRHVQVADAPGRGEPGSGELPISATLEALDVAGYDGPIGCEYRPTTATVDTLGWIPAGTPTQD